jgi:hypothetical protein
MGDVPEMMRCDRLQMTLSRPGCARLWEAAARKRPEAWEGRAACRNCSIGAANAGKKVDPSTVALDEIRMVCSRCTRTASRLINNELCVSCYNRHREVLVGRNAKGHRPLLADVLHRQIIAVIERDGDRMVRSSLAVGAAELMIAAARRASGPIAFSRPGVAFDG